MERIVGVALRRYLSAYVEGEIKFQDYTLHDIEFKADVLHELVGMPPQLAIRKATCKKIWAKIPWYSLGREPIVLVADDIHLELHEPTEVRAPPPRPPQQVRAAPSFTDRVFDNIRFEIGSITLRLHPLVTRDKPVLEIALQEIAMHSTNSRWEPEDLRTIHKVNAAGHVLLYRRLDIDRMSVALRSEDGDTQIVTDIPVQLRVKNKKEYFGGPVVHFELDIQLPHVALQLHRRQFKQAQALLDALMEMLYRPVDSSDSSDSQPNGGLSAPPPEPDIPTPSSDSNSSSTAGRFSSWWRGSSAPVASPAEPVVTPTNPTSSGWFGRLSSWYYTAPQPVEQNDRSPDADEAFNSADEADYSSDVNEGLEGAASLSPVESTEAEGGDETYYSGDETEVVEPSQENLSSSLPDSDSNLTESMPDEAGTLISDEEDLTQTVYRVRIDNGTVALSEWQDGADLEHGLVTCSFEGFSLSLHPAMNHPDDPIVLLPETRTPLARAELALTVASYSLELLDPPQDRHPAYTILVRREQHAASAHLPMLDLRFTKRPKQPRAGLSEDALQKLGWYVSDLQLVFSHVYICYDVGSWERLYRFFFTGHRGRQFEQYMGSNLEYLVEAALEGYFVFGLRSCAPIVVLPPLAGHAGPSHVAAQVLHLYLDDVSVSSASAASSRPQPFALPSTSFPTRPGDISQRVDSAGVDAPAATHKFVAKFVGMRGSIMAEHGAPSHELLAPFDLTMLMWLHEFATLPSDRPHLEVMALTTPLKLRMTQLDYQYVFWAFGERIRWSPEATAPKPKVPSAEVPPLFLALMQLWLPQLDLTLLSGQNLATELAALSMGAVHYARELRMDCTLTKATFDTLRIRDCPAAELGLPFADLVAPLSRPTPPTNAVAVRYFAPVSGVARMWAEVHALRVGWIYSLLAALQTFFTTFTPPAFETAARPFELPSAIDDTPSTLDWEVVFDSCEALVVDSPTTPECFPLSVQRATLTRTLEGNAIRYYLDGLLQVHSLMHRSDTSYVRTARSRLTTRDLERRALTEELRMRASYVTSKANNLWRSDISVGVPRLSMTVTPAQYVMLLTALDSQLRDVRAPLPFDLQHQLTSRVRLEIEEFLVRIDGLTTSIATFGARRVAYVSEDWQDTATLQLEFDAPTLLPHRSGAPPTLLRSRIDANRSSPDRHSKDNRRSSEEDSPYRRARDDDFRPRDEPTVSPFRRSTREAKRVESRRSETAGKRKAVRRPSLPMYSPPRTPVHSAGPSPSRSPAPSGSDTLVLRLKHETQYRSGENGHERVAIEAQWLIEVDSIEFVYDPETMSQLRDFFTVSERHTYLRRAYQRLQARVRSLYMRDDTESETASGSGGAEPIPVSQVRSGSFSNLLSLEGSSVGSVGSVGFVGSVDNLPLAPALAAEVHAEAEAAQQQAAGEGAAQQLIHIVLRRPLILLQSRRAAAGEADAPVLAWDAQFLEVTNHSHARDESRSDEESVYSDDDEPALTATVATTAVTLTGVQVGLVSRHNTGKLLQPVNMSLLIRRGTLTQRPFLHVEVHLETIRARLSVERLGALVSIANHYARRIAGAPPSAADASATPQVASDGSSSSPPPASSSSTPPSLAPAPPQESGSNGGWLVDCVLEVACREMNVAIVSDYEADLELLYTHLKNQTLQVELYGPTIRAELQCRAEVLVNNLTYLTPERLVDQTHLSLTVAVTDAPDGGDDGEADVAEDDESSAESPRVSPRRTGARVDASLVVLDALRVSVSPELVRQLAELYHMASNGSSWTSSQHSHFHYVLENATEATLTFSQAGTADKRILSSGDRSPFAFSNPYLPPLLDFQLEGWSGAVPQRVDDAGSILLRLFNTLQNDIEREILVTVRPRGLKRSVTIHALHRMRNLTDAPLEVAAYWTRKSWTRALRARSYIVPPSLPDAPKTTPLLARGQWGQGLLLAVRLAGDAWQYSAQFALEKTEFVRRLELAPTDPNRSDSRLLFLTVTKDSDGLVTLTFSPPLQVVNLSQFAMSYKMGDIDGIVPPLATRALCVDTAESSIRFLIDGAVSCDKELRLSSIGRTEVVMHRDPAQLSDRERRDIAVNCFTRYALSRTDAARVVYLNTQYVLINETDLIMFVQQRVSAQQERASRVMIPPHSRVPFSWLRGTRQVHVRVGGTPWSHGLNITKPGATQLTIPLPGSPPCALTMQVLQLDPYAHAVTFRPRLHIHNKLLVAVYVQPQSQRADLNGQSESSDYLDSAPPASELASVSVVLPAPPQELECPPGVVTPSLLAPSAALLAMRSAPPVPLPLKTPGTYTLLLEDSNLMPVAVDVDIVMSAGGTQVTLAPNTAPPYMVHNLTPFDIRIRAAPTSRVPEPSRIVRIAAGSSVAYYPSQAAATLQVAIDAPSEDRSDAAQRRRLRLFERSFSKYRRPWCHKFTADVQGQHKITFHVPDHLVPVNTFEDFELVPSTPRSVVTALNELALSIVRQGATNSLTFTMPIDGSHDAEQIASSVVSVALSLPRIEVRVLVRSEERVCATFDGLIIEAVRLSADRFYAYCVLHTLQVDYLHESPEYPVLLKIDWRRLNELVGSTAHIVHALELLGQVSRQESATFIEYFGTDHFAMAIDSLGMRLLPTIVRVDGMLLGETMAFWNELSPEDPAALTNEEETFSLAQQKRLAQYTLSANVPASTDASVALRHFTRSQLAGAASTLSASVLNEYGTEVWSELYKIIGDLDALASPTQTLRKLVRGFKDFVWLPMESLVLDDTPGAFLVGLIGGWKSLLLNLSDVTLTSYLRICASISWLIHSGCLDDEYQATVAGVARTHPRSFLEGATQLGRGVWAGVSGLVTLPWRGVETSGGLGFAAGVGRAFVGLPLKPLGAVFEFQRIICDGILHSLGRGVDIDTPLQASTSEGTAAFHQRALETWLPSGTKGSEVLTQSVRVLDEDSRLKDRLLALIPSCIYLFNLKKLGIPQYAPRVFPYRNIARVLRPTLPETDVFIELSQPLYGHSQIHIITPNREQLLQHLSTVYALPVEELRRGERLPS